MITFEDFKKIELKVATIITAGKIDNSEKLLRLEVDLAGEKKQIIAGLAKHYSQEELIGREIVVVTNLEPRTLAGLESQGMLLAAHDENGNPVILIPEKNVPSGSQIT